MVEHEQRQRLRRLDIGARDREPDDREQLPVPGKRTLTESLVDTEITADEAAGFFDRAMQWGRSQLVELRTAIAAIDASDAIRAAGSLEIALDCARGHIAKLPAAKRAESERALDDLREVAVPLLAQAENPGREAVTGSSKAWNRETEVSKGNREGRSDGAGMPEGPLQIAAKAVDQPGQPIPFQSLIQRSFGRHDVSRIQAHIGGRAGDASRAFGARAFAFGENVAFAGTPDVHTAAHEATHVVQQRAGVALYGGIGQAGDVHEQQADEVADLVAAGESAEPVLDRIAGSGATTAPAMPVVQRKEDSPGPPTGDSSNAMRFIPFVKEWPLPGVGKVKVQIRFEASFKREGELKTKAGKLEAGVGEKKLILEKKLTKGAVDASAKINNSLLSLGEKLLDGGDTMIAGVAVALKVEAKFLDAELSLDELKLDAAKITIIGEGDFTHQVPELVGKAKLVGQLRLEVALNAEMVHDLYKLAEASQKLKRAAEIESKLAEGKRALANRKKIHTKLKARGNLSAVETQRLKALEAEIKQLQGQTGKLTKLRAGAIKGRDAALKTVSQLGAKFARTKLGKVVSRLAAKAVGFVFKKFLPVYNIVSTAIDLIDITGKIIDAGKVEWGSGQGDSAVGGKGQSGGGSGSGGARGGSDAIDGDSSDPMPDLDATGLEPAGPVQLTPTAQEALKTLLQKTVYSVGKPLDDDEKAIINRVVPTDLSTEELAALSKVIGGKTGAATPIPQLVIEAMQRIRPDGKKLPSVHVNPQQPQPQSQPSPRPARPQRARKGASGHSGTGKKGAPTSVKVIDLDGWVADNAHVDHTRAVTFPPEIKIGGVTLRRLRARVRLDIRVDDVHWVEATFRVTAVTSDNTPRVFNDGTPVERSEQTTVLVKVKPDLSP